MTNKKIDKQEIQELLELTRTAEQKTREMCELIVQHSAKYQQWSKEGQATKYSVPSK